MNALTQPGKKIIRYLFEHPELLVERKHSGLTYPIHTELDLTWRCALNCKGCHSKWLHQGIELTLPQVKIILGQLHDHGCKAVTWAGGGEPLESPIWREAMEIAYMLDFRQSVYTYMPEPSQEKVNFIENYCDFAYTHVFKTNKVFRPFAKNCVWTAGFLLDSENWTRFPEMIEKVDFTFFDYCDFRPLCPTNEPNPKPLSYSWIPEFIDLFHELYASEPKVKFAEYKFLDLLKSNGGRDYASCLSTDFVACIGPNGDCYECLNRRGFADSVLGNLLTEDLETIWKRKARSREDFSSCRILCRGHEDNKELYQLMGPAPKHEVFV